MVDKSSCASAYSIENSGISSETSKLTVDKLYPPVTIFIFNLNVPCGKNIPWVSLFTKFE